MEHADRPIARVIDAFGAAVPDATFVQVGAHDGEALDPLRKQLATRRWRGVLVEPVPYVFERLQARYGDEPRVTLVNAAVADVDGTRPLHALRQAATGDEVWPWYDALASFRRDVVLAHRHLVPDIEDRIETIDVDCLTFDTLCERSGLDHVDVVQIDTEGYDLEILRLVDIGRRRPALVGFEHLHLDAGELDEAHALVDRHGYERIADGMDTLAVRRDALAAHPELAAEWRAARAASRSPRAPVAARAKELARAAVRRAGYDVRRHRPEDELALVDTTTPLPPEATALHEGNERLAELRARYAAVDGPVVRHSRWRSPDVLAWLELARFRGDNAYLWHYRGDPETTRLRFLVLHDAVARQDHAGLLARLEEDGALGCWTQALPGRPVVSRDLLDSVAELSFLDRHVGLLGAAGVRVLDIGAGWGRLAHRAVTANPRIADWACTDAVPESTFLAEWYLRWRAVSPPARVIELPDVASLEPGTFDLACNVHSWSECGRGAIRWWVAHLDRLGVRDVFVVPNEREGFLSTEPDGRRLDYRSVLEAAGYALVVDQPAINDPAAREALGVHDRHCLFRR